MINVYSMELDHDRLPVLVKEKEVKYSDKINSPQTIVDMCNTVMRLKYSAEEKLIMIAANCKLEVIGIFVVSQGTENETQADPKRIFLRALTIGASRIVILHNHPTGDVTPSKNDIVFYDRIKKGCEILGIDMVDSIIVGNGFYSFKEEKSK